MKYKIKTSNKEIRYVSASEVVPQKDGFLAFTTDNGQIYFDRTNLISYEEISDQEFKKSTAVIKTGVVSG